MSEFDRVVLCHGTTLSRANRLLQHPPNALYIEPGGSFYDAAGGFSTAIQGAPDYGLGTPTQYAQNKAKLFPNEGGPVILNVELPVGIVEIVTTDDDLGPAAASGDVRFEPGVGLEELIAAWPTLKKWILPL